MGHNPLHEGLVVAAHGRHYTVEMPDGSLRKCFPRGKKAGTAVGDRVVIEPQGADEGVIVRQLERRNLLYRSDEMRTKLFAANVDLLLIVVAVEPAFSDELIGRALVATRCAGIKPLVILNKVDLLAQLPAAQARIEKLRGLGLEVIELSALDTEQVNAKLLPLLKGRTALLLGQSGMGKSTLLNALVPKALAPTQEHSVALDAGKHTTTSTRLYHLPDGSGDLIDSPGFQNFGLSHLSAGNIERGFPEFEALLGECRFYNCTHLHEPGCGILAAVEKGTIARERHDLYKRLLAEHEDQNRY
ncbi:ribosome small subunit-dependent GTPase A [Eoetvoesiella caeni]|uniref:Small ribosomal subunit biogenesis GTPase RsgA n=1 Tax=Eoetvoesiella caeni TaxID=645616 RepID=A0A366HLQ0_9BURK|nr:ribosome small subunit-dependent GTPase A [Eoetvoesiella caeni]MCI2807354.1 ribosome small subunit-dependent GTPase A [Eoetvoesiella caeni]NYT53252.1 ribosome small subunit-dependent GTPase A [Eoetvoesiella caeni]RBP43232.1 ribosome biogenesis GTPase [Eoetvoesiella caeni]